jgi:hypothetical protein
MAFETSVRIERAVDEVFDYVSNPRYFSRWNSAVQAGRVPLGEGDPGSTYLIERSFLAAGRRTSWRSSPATAAPSSRCGPRQA